MNLKPARGIIATFLMAAIFMTVYETVKELIFAGSLSAWESHAITIFVTACIAAGASIIMRRQTALVIMQKSQSVEKELRRINDQLSLSAKVIQVSSEGIIVTNPDGVIESVNPAFSEITGYSEAEVIGNKPSLLRSDHHDPAFYAELWATLLSTKRWQGEITNRRKDGEIYLIRTTISAILDPQGQTTHYVGVFQDVTRAREKEERVRHLAFHDALTGLPNRLLLRDRLEHAIRRAQRDQTRLAVIFTDMDGFKEVNDLFGHDVGDLFLKKSAARIREQIRRSSDTVARLGGDEFVVVLEDISSVEDVEQVLQGIITTISEPITLRGHRIQCGISIGYAISPEDGVLAGDLLKHADFAMYAAKSSGKNTFRRFSQDMLSAI